MEKKFSRQDMDKKKWFENLWYYYRWHTLIAFILLLLVGLFIKDMVTQERYDATVMLAARQYITEEQTVYLASLLEELGTDLDANGEVNYEISALSFPSDPESGMGSQTQMAMQTKFVAELSSGTAIIMMLDDYTFAQMQEPEYFTDLGALGLPTLPDGRRIPLKDLIACEGTPLEPLKDHLYVVLRSAETASLVKKKEEGAALHADQQALLQALYAA